MSDSSSTEDESEFLKEAVDTSLFRDDLYKENKCIKKVEDNNEVKLPPSLRNQNQSYSSFNPMEIKVTPEFRKHVAKHLRRIMDGLIDDSEELPLKSVQAKVAKKSKGIKLLKLSHHHVKMSSEEVKEHIKRSYVKHKRRRIDGDTSSEDEEKRAIQVAVSPEWVLSKKETENWAPCTKGVVEVIKLQ